MRGLVQGFTLLELLVVTVILAVAASAVVPNFVKSIQAAQLRTSAENLTAAVRLAQIRAMTQGRPHRVVLDETGYWLEREAVDQSSAAARTSNKPSFEGLEGKAGRKSMLAAGVVLKEYPAEIAISSSGRIAPCEFKVCRTDDCVLVAAGRELGQVQVVQEKEAEHAVL